MAYQYGRPTGGIVGRRVPTEEERRRLILAAQQQAIAAQQPSLQNQGHLLREKMNDYSPLQDQGHLLREKMSSRPAYTPTLPPDGLVQENQLLQIARQRQAIAAEARTRRQAQLPEQDYDAWLKKNDYSAWLKKNDPDAWRREYIEENGLTYARISPGRRGPGSIG